MWATIIATVASAVIGGTVKGVAAYKNTMARADAYEKAAQQIRASTEKHSGERLYQDMMNTGTDYASKMGTAAGNLAAAEEVQPVNPGTTGAGANAAAYQAATNAANTANEAANQGFSNGVDFSKNKNAAEYDAETTAAKQLAKQAGIEADANQQAVKEAFGVASDAANTYSSLRRSRNGRDIK